MTQPITDHIYFRNTVYVYYVSSWQVNGIPLIGETHKEVVNILKELPKRVCLVCSHVVPPAIPDSDEEDDDDAHLTLKELLAEFNDKVRAHIDERWDECLNLFPQYKPHLLHILCI